MYIIKSFACLLLLILGTSCIYDYDVSEQGKGFSPKIVINGIITESDSNVLSFAWSVPDFNTEPLPLKNAHVIIKENDNNIVDSMFETLDTLIVRHKFGKGCTYKINVMCDGNEASSTATIPENHTFSIDTTRNKYNSATLIQRNWTVDISFSKISEKNNFLIKSTIYDHLWRKVKLYDLEYNGMIPYADDINMEITMGVENGIYYNGFVRIPNKNLHLVKENIKFEFNDVYKGKYIVMDFMTTPEGYDRYYRSRYEYKKFYEDIYDLPGLINPAVPIYNNISGGIGIFDGAGIKQVVFENPYYQKRYE